MSSVPPVAPATALRPMEKIVAPDMGRTAEYRKELTTAQSCLFCQGGTSFFLKQVAGDDGYKLGEELPKPTPERKLWDGPSTFAHFNSWPAQGAEVIPGVFNPNNGTPRGHHYVVVPRRHLLEIAKLAPDEIDELVAVSWRIIPNGFDLWYCRQGKNFARTGATVAHAHFHSIRIGSGEVVETGFGKWDSVNAEERAKLIRYEGQWLSPVQLTGINYAFAMGPWRCYEVPPYASNVERDFVIELELRHVHNFDELCFNYIHHLFTMIGEIDHRFGLPAGILWYDRIASRQGETLQVRYFLPEEDKLVICRAAKAA